MILNARFVPTDDMSYTLAVELPTGKYRHYKVTHQLIHFLVEQAAGGSGQLDKVIEIVRDQVKKDFGPNYDIGVLNGNEVDDQFSGNATRRIITLPAGIFRFKTVEALKRRQTNGMTYRYQKNISVWPDFIARGLDYLTAKVLTYPIGFLNRAFAQANRLLIKAYGVETLWDGVELALQDGEAFIEDGGEQNDYFRAEAAYSKAVEGKFFFKFITTKSRFESYSKPCAYLARTCGQEDLDAAIELIGSDLDKAVDLGLVFGNLSMPKIVELNNVVGNGKKVYSVFCFFILDTDKIKELAGPGGTLDVDEDYAQSLANLGITTAVREGASSGTYPYLDEIESVEVTRNYTPNDKDNTPVFSRTWIDDSKPSDSVFKR